MDLFQELGERGHEQVSFFHDSDSGLKGLVAFIIQYWVQHWAAAECGIMKMKQKHW